MSSARVEPIRLLLVDDHEVVRVGLRTLLHNNQGITVVDEAGSSAAAVRAVTRLNPDIVLMDARLPDGSGVEAAREIHASHPTTRIIFLTSYADDDSALAAVLADAQGYVLKNFDSGLLIQSIRNVFTGHSIFHPASAPVAPDGTSAGPGSRRLGAHTAPCPSRRARVGVGGGRIDQQADCGEAATHR